MFSDTYWNDFTDEQHAEYRAEFVRSWVYETGCSEDSAEMAYEQFLNQEGWHNHDKWVDIRQGSKEYVIV